MKKTFFLLCILSSSLLLNAKEAKISNVNEMLSSSTVDNLYDIGFATGASIASINDYQRRINLFYKTIGLQNQDMTYLNGVYDGFFESGGFNQNQGEFSDGLSQSFWDFWNKGIVDGIFKKNEQ